MTQILGITYSPLVKLISHPTNDKALEASFSYCRKEVKRYDPDRYFSSLLLGREQSCALHSLYAFNLEIAKIPETVSEPILGQIRLQWWRDAIEDMFAGKLRGHPIINALVDTMAVHRLDQSCFERLLEARESDLKDQQPLFTSELVSYASGTSGDLMCLALNSIDIVDHHLLEVAREAGIAWALTGLLLAIPYHAARNRCYLPKSLTDEYAIDVSALFAGRKVEDLRLIVHVMVEEAQKHLTLSRNRQMELSANGRRVLSHVAIAAKNLHRIERANFNVFNIEELTPLRRQWVILSSALRKFY